MRAATGVLTAGTASTLAVTSMGIPPPRVTEGFNTVDVARFANGAAAVRAEWELDAAPGGHRFLFVGMLIERKNVAGLLSAFELVREPGDSLTVVGTGPLDAQLRKQAVDLGLGLTVQFVGHLEGDALTAAYGTAHTFVLSSTAEVWGLVVNEALAAGLNVVVADVAGVAPDIAGMPGVFLAPPTPGGLAAGMARSRSGWAGHRTDHPVMAHTPSALADVVTEMVGSAGARS
jgi:glycosyltransferase involved in cell wall biosynthesis